jgi:hypothetical protein
MQRIEGYVPLIGPIITLTLKIMSFVTDKIMKNWFSNKFGFQLIVKGVKA